MIHTVGFGHLEEEHVWLLTSDVQLVPFLVANQYDVPIQAFHIWALVRPAPGWLP